MARSETIKLHDQVLALGSLYQNAPRHATAVLMLPGGGSGVAATRLTQPRWQLYSDDLWVAGTRGDPAYTREDIVGYIARKGQLPARLETQLLALHTQNQMQWAVKMLLKNLFINHLIISTATYHLARGVLTFIKQWLRNGDGRKLTVGVLQSSDPDDLFRATASSTSKTFEEELERIERYQRKGDVATQNEFLEFLKKNS